MSRRDPPRLRAASSDSPCVNVCTLHPDGSHCLGCFRTVDEIGGWSTYSDARRAEVNALLDERRAARRAALREERRAGRHARGANHAGSGE